jgi:hypothetical protein
LFLVAEGQDAILLVGGRSPHRVHGRWVVDSDKHSWVARGIRRSGKLTRSGAENGGPMWGLLGNIGLLLVVICVVWREHGRSNKRLWIFFVAGTVFYGSIQEICIEIIRWLLR